MSERLNKVLADLGYGSRRAMDRMIQTQKITVNGKRAELGQKVTGNDVIQVDGKTVTLQKTPLFLLAFHKPRGVVTTKKDRFASSTVMHFLPPKFQHLYPVGRLDKLSRGLLLLTNNGQYALSVTHPRFEHTKEYKVRLKTKEIKSKEMIESDFKRIQHSIINPNAQSKPITILNYSFHSPQTIDLSVRLQEGKKRQIRQLFDTLGYQVTDLIRTKIGHISLADIKEGEYRDITPSDWQ